MFLLLHCHQHTQVPSFIPFLPRTDLHPSGLSSSCSLISQQLTCCLQTFMGAAACPHLSTFQSPPPTRGSKPYCSFHHQLTITFFQHSLCFLLELFFSINKIKQLLLLSLSCPFQKMVVVVPSKNNIMEINHNNKLLNFFHFLFFLFLVP